MSPGNPRAHVLQATHQVLDPLVFQKVVETVALRRISGFPCGIVLHVGSTLVLEIEMTGKGLAAWMLLIGLLWIVHMIDLESYPPGSVQVGIC